MRLHISTGTLSLVFALPALASSQQAAYGPHRPDLNAFVNHKVNDTRSLLNEVRNNRVVADRYERHFSMTRQQVLDYLSTLHREGLANTARYRVYSIPASGVVKMHYEVLKKGTPVFVDPNGKPNLIVKCGNPLIAGRAITPRAAPVAVRPVPPQPDDRDLPTLRDAPLDLTNTSVDDMPILPEISPDLLSAAPLLPAVTTLTSTLPAAAIAHSLPLLGLAPLLAPIFGSSHGGGGGNIVFFPTPEPAPFAALGLGAAVLVRRRRRA